MPQGDIIPACDNNRIKMIRKTGSVDGLTPDSLEVTEKKTMAKLKIIVSFKGHPLHCVVNGLRSLFCERSLDCF